MSRHSTPSDHLSFPRLLLRIAFVVGLLLLLAAPQLRSPAPAPLFRWLRDFLQAISLWQWLLILFGVFALGWLVTLPARLGGAELAAESAAARLPISEAVSPAKGGNGLATAPFQPALPWLGLAGWVEIKEAGKECMVIDGRRVLRTTSFLAVPSRLIGRPISARRLLLQPAPLTDISTTATTADNVSLTLVVSAKYDVLDPLYAASVQAPLQELVDLLAGAVRNFVPSDTLLNILLNEGGWNEEIKRRVSESPSLAGRYKIVEVTKATPTGDQRVIETINQTREAIRRRALKAQERQVRRLQEEADLELERRFKEQEERFKEREHQRDADISRLQELGETQRQMLKKIGAIAAADMNPTGVLDAITRIRALYSGTVQLPPSVRIEGGFSLIESERRELEEISSDLGLRTYAVEPDPERQECPQSAWLTFDGYGLLIECPKGYPTEAPVVKLLLGVDPARTIEIPWVPGNRIADAVISAAAQTPLNA